MNYVDMPTKDELLSQIRTYCHQNYPQKTSSVPPLSYAGRIFDEEEVVNLIDSALEFWLTNGRYSEQFERDLAKFLDVTYCSFVNSGSSANLLAFMALTAPELGKRAFPPLLRLSSNMARSPSLSMLRFQPTILTLVRWRALCHPGLRQL